MDGSNPGLVLEVVSKRVHGSQSQQCKDMRGLRLDSFSMRMSNLDQRIAYCGEVAQM